MKICNTGILIMAPLLLLLFLVLGMSLTALADLRPISRSMLANLQATNTIGESLAIEDYAAVETAAQDLQNRARELLTWDVAQLGFTPASRAESDAYLKLQAEISGKIIRSARQKDAPAIVAGFSELLEKSCLACHSSFRDRQGMLKASTLFMTSFVGAWREINRGLLLNDFTLVERNARALVVMGQVMSWDSVIQTSFNLPKDAQRSKFREHLARMIAAAGRIEDGASRGELGTVQKALNEMWSMGCLSCHKEFR
ncbi:MAG: hypothetical protein A3G24_00240 [Betaproteobacteria bacterium RIFCSPLOWO2_12_FULL_62_13]|nr:MAG: hypothetical protein A3G24_00240 [Betaproteobacteria bacterium RIFCSPLOWO2_12_FULL_62_13]